MVWPGVLYNYFETYPENEKTYSSIYSSDLKLTFNYTGQVYEYTSLTLPEYVFLTQYSTVDMPRSIYNSILYNYFYYNDDNIYNTLYVTDYPITIKYNALKILPENSFVTGTDTVLFDYLNWVQITVDHYVDYLSHYFKFKLDDWGLDIVNITWDLDDGIIVENQKEVSVYYITAGYKTIKAFLTYEDGAEYTIEQADYIYVKDFTIDFVGIPSWGNAPLSVKFIPDLTNNPNYTILLWEFGDGTTSGELSPVKIYNKQGAYTVKLTVWNQEGYERFCVKSKYVLVSKKRMYIYKMNSAFCFMIPVDLSQGG